MRFKASILESVQQSTKQILNILKKEISKIFDRSSNNIQKDLKRSIGNAIRSQPEYTSLKSGSLRYELGIPDISAVDQLVDRFADSVSVNINNVSITGNRIDAALVFTIMADEDLDTILSSAEASVVTEKGDVLPWLKWLLLMGKEPIILTHKVLVKPSPYSRTGQAIMIPTKSGSWRVPPAYAGTLDNNWITRALSSIESEINNILTKYISSN